MAEVKSNACDNCGKRTEDRYAEVGWICIDVTGSASLYRTAGRRKDDRGSKSDFLMASGGLEFCSLICLKGALDKAAAKRNTAERARKP